MSGNSEEEDLHNYVLEYNNYFKNAGSVQFKFRATSQKVNDQLNNGDFKFYIDNED
jgi:hypothetical protein